MFDFQKLTVYQKAKANRKSTQELLKNDKLVKQQTTSFPELQ